jgi:hypothetical protein
MTYLAGSDLSGSLIGRAKAFVKKKKAKKQKAKKKAKGKPFAAHKPPVYRPRPVRPVLKAGAVPAVPPAITQSSTEPSLVPAVSASGGGAPPLMSFTDSSGSPVEVNEGSPGETDVVTEQAAAVSFRPSPLMLAALAIGALFLFRKGR